MIEIVIVMEKVASIKQVIGDPTSEIAKIIPTTEINEMSFAPKKSNSMWAKLKHVLINQSNNSGCVPIVIQHTKYLPMLCNGNK